MQCLSERCLAGANIFQAARGYRHVLGRKMRFNGLLLCNISRYFSQSKYIFHKKVDSYGRASRLYQRKLCCKVFTSMCHDGRDEVFDEEKDDFDASLARKQFPSIMIGQSIAVELYDGVSDGPEKSSSDFTGKMCNDHLATKVVDPDMLYDSLGKISKDFNSFSSYEFVSIKDQSTTGSTSSLSILQSGISSSKEEKSQNKVKSESKWSGDDSSNKVALSGQLHSGPFEPVLDKSISCVSTLSKKQCSQLENCGLHTIRKLLNHFPRTYADLQNAQSRIDDGQYLIFVGKVMSSRGIKANCSLSFLEVIVGCEVSESVSASACSVSENSSGSKRTIYLHLKKFFRGTRFTYQPFLKSLQDKQKPGDIVCVSGKVRTMRTKDHYEMREYSLDLIRDDDDESACAEGRPYPIYPSKGGLNPKLLGNTIARVLDSLPSDIDPVPENILQMFGLLNLRDAYIGIHQPANFNEADLARRRIIFDEFFYLQLGRLFQMLEGLGSWIEKDGLLDKYRNPTTNATLSENWCTLTKKFLKILPYSLTSSQLSAVSEIIWDLKRQVPMNRLLQGDVGCGKTVVAFLACMEVIGSGYQAAFMVPTELLAIQHHDHLLNLLEKMDDIDCKPSVALLTGSIPTKKARLIREGLQSGEIALVIGTHSLIAEKVEFSSLRIAVVDEQHRFGVIQRGRFNSKLYYNSINSRLVENDSGNISKGDLSMAPHVLAMTATPIPRTLALALYGDMSLTQITDLPPGRKPIDTFIVEGNETGFKQVYQMMREELDSGGRVYVVYPIIEQSEQLPQLRGASADLEVISNTFEGINCGLLHGRMKSDEKDDALRRFRSGDTQILLSTLVVEIGVDVPEASMMVVMNAERFGLAQLHQLRGRVGRGVRKSKCVLLSSTSSGLGRLEVLEKSSDGFQLANMDLLLRGPGDLLGRKQSGHLPEFPIARLEIDGNILQEAHLAALTILSDSNNLESFPALKAELSMRQPLCLLGD
ncbi:ATP-dependent DNA helicase homolog RECG1, chloroplastic/mitochondrial [Rutidosis leptorrhynchoides]|uniref:ATP-dependent DNA helicase homolog RECG1, chloroplastic/mitochondrial n=1 Tax=Rutidosis leptorrhynchoides TaxID=125765 RepID=UPI003A99B462